MPWGEGQRVSPQGCVAAALGAASLPLLGGVGGGWVRQQGGSKSSRWLHSSWGPRQKQAIHCCAVLHTMSRDGRAPEPRPTSARGPRALGMAATEQDLSQTGLLLLSS